MGAAGEHHSLRDATALDPLGTGRYAVDIDDDYTIAGRPNGGYLQCVVANAALAAAAAEGSSHLHVTSATTSYSGAPSVGPAEVRTEVRRVGRSVSFVHVALVQGDQVTSESLVTLGTLRDEAPIRYLDVTVPEVAPLEECVPRTVVEEIKLMRVVDLRLDPSCAMWLDGRRGERGEVKGWLRLNDDEPWNAWSLLFATDGLPPGTFPLGSTGWVPTLQLTSYVHRVPRAQWLRARQWCTIVTDGRVEERCELFDETNALVASSSQLAMVRFAENS